MTPCTRWRNALAIQEAEKTATGGLLKLTCWRAGKTNRVQLELRVMGTYRDTAPYDCPKSKLIFEDACLALEKEPLKDDLWGAVNGLALLATGRPESLPRVQAYARKIAPPTLKLQSKSGMVTWDGGYRNLFLGGDPIQLTHGERAAALFQGLLHTSIKAIEAATTKPELRSIAPVPKP